MPIPPGSLQRLYDFSDPLCYPGSGTTVFNTAQAAYYFQRVNNPTFVSDGQKSHFVFNRASQQYLGAGNNSTSIGGPYNTMTINVWFQSTDDTAVSTLFSFGYNSPSGVQPTIFLNDASFAFTAGKASASFNYGVGYTNTTNTYSTNTWYMITMVADGTNTKIYLNGVLEGTAAQGGGTWPYNGGSYIGCLGDSIGNPWTSAPFFSGKVAYLSQYNVALDAADILTIYNTLNSRFNPVPSGPVSRIDLLDPACYSGTGNTIFDLVNPSAKWQISGSKTYDSVVGAITWGAASTINLDTQLAASGTTGRTMAAWIKWPQDGPVAPGEGVQPFLQIGDNSSYNNMCLTMASNTEIGGRFPILKSGDSFNSIVTAVAYSPAWTFVAMTVPNSAGASSGSIYLNGTTVGTPLSYNIPAGTLNVTYTSNQFGLYNNDFGLYGVQSSGTVSQHWIYDRVLDAGEISTLYASTVDRYYPPIPVAEFDFQNPSSYPGTGNTVYDLSGTGNTLAITAGGTFVSGTPSYFNLNNDTAIWKAPAVGGIAGTNVYTINVWYNQTASDNGIVAMAGKDIANQSAQFAIGFGSTIPVASGGFGFGILPFTGATVPGWNFLSFVSTGSSTTAYLNGASVGTTTNVPSIPADGGIIIGTALNNGSPPSPRMDLTSVGQIGYMSVFTEALTPAQIQDIYDATETPYIPSPPPSSNGVGGRQFAQGFNG